MVGEKNAEIIRATEKKKKTPYLYDKSPAKMKIPLLTKSNYLSSKSIFLFLIILLKSKEVGESRVNFLSPIFFSSSHITESKHTKNP